MVYVWHPDYPGNWAMYIFSIIITAGSFAFESFASATIAFIANFVAAAAVVAVATFFDRYHY